MKVGFGYYKRYHYELVMQYFASGLTNTEINEKVMNHEILKEELNNPDYGDNRKKHLLQASSILGILQSYNLLRDNTCFVEFGAGKGKVMMNFFI